MEHHIPLERVSECGVRQYAVAWLHSNSLMDFAEVPVSWSFILVYFDFD